MKKKELYQRFDLIKQDKLLKERILNAVEERDKIEVIKRPVFIPVMIALLLCLNIGMITKLVIFNKSQVNMSDFKARTSMDSATSEKELIEQLEQDRLQLTQEEMEIQFANAKSDFLAEIGMNKYNIVATWTDEEDYNPAKDSPFYLNSDDSIKFGGYSYRRYVQVLEFGDFEIGATLETTYVLTNHEYIVGYDGKGFEEQNIKSITESDVNTSEINDDIIDEARQQELQSVISDKAIKVGEQIIQTFEHYSNATSQDIYIKDLYYMFPKSVEDGTGSIIYQCNASINFPVQTDKSYERDYFFFNTDAADVSDYIKSTTKGYWKQTFYTFLEPETEAETVLIPDLTGMSVTEAEYTLENVGLKLGSITYQPPSDSTINHDEVMYLNNYYAGEEVYEGTEISVVLCGKMIPDLFGLSVDEAVYELEKYDLNANIEYEDGVDPEDAGLYIDRISPSAGSAITEGDTVTIYIVSSDISTSSLIGRGIDFKQHIIYSRNQTLNILSNETPSESVTVDLTEYDFPEYEDIEFYGKYYGDIFYVESFKTTSQTQYATRTCNIKCGMSENELNLLTDYELDGSTLTEFVLDYYDYVSEFAYSDGRNIIAYIKIENAIISEIYVSE